jgi:hypothetical protein
VACGFSCRHQIADGTGRRSQHVVEILADRLMDAPHGAEDSTSSKTGA